MNPDNMPNCPDNDDEKIVAVMHDIVEDTNITFDDLQNEGFSDQVISAIQCVTKRKEKITIPLLNESPKIPQQLK